MHWRPSSAASMRQVKLRTADFLADCLGQRAQFITRQIEEGLPTSFAKHRSNLECFEGPGVISARHLRTGSKVP
jgi:hypothetical protein